MEKSGVKEGSKKKCHNWSKKNKKKQNSKQDAKFRRMMQRKEVIIFNSYNNCKDQLKIAIF